MRINFETKLALGSFVAVTILAAVCAISLISIRNADQTKTWVAHTYQVLGELQTTLASLSDAEAGMRGYLLTGDGAYLQRQASGEEQTKVSLGKLQQMTLDNPAQQERIANLQQKTEEKISFLKQVTDTRDRVGVAAALTLFATGRARELMDAAHLHADEVEATERELLAQRQLSAGISRANNIRTVLIASLVDALLLAFALVMIRREMKARHAAEQTLREDAERLTVMVKTQGDIADRELDLNEVLAMVTSRALHLTGAAGASIDVVEGDRLVERAGTGIAAATFALRRKMFARLTEDCFERAEAIICEDVEGPGKDTGIDSSPHARSAILLPLRDGNRVVGVLKVLSDRVQAFSKRDAQTLELIAGFIATAMRNANAFQARQLLIEQLTVVNEELEAFTASASHDLRAPLRHIQGFADLLRKHLPSSLDAKGEHYLKVIARSAAQMGLLIDDLLDFARVGRAQVQREKINTESLAHAVIENMQSEVNGRTIDWRVGPLPEVQADANMLRQVMINLFSNAVKYTRPRAEAVIETGASRENGEFVFYVRDNGVGFEPKYASKLFGVFQRLHRAEEFEGTGIGLANVRRVIQKHGGRTWAEGKLNAGATFYFTIPVAIPASV